MDEIPAWAMKQADIIFVDIACEDDRGIITEIIASALVAERERAAKIAEAFTTSEHIAHDMGSGIFPKQSEIREAIAAAIRKGE